MSTNNSWSAIEAIVRQRLELNELDRRYCAVCGRQGSSLSRCFGCQMVYYCGEEHQAEDWSKEHAQKCTQLEWVALGEFIQALPAQPPLPNIGDKWPIPLKEIHNWRSWFSMRTNIVHLANNTANVLKTLLHLTDKRQPTDQTVVDGLLAAVTDQLTHVLTIGKAVVYFGLQPNICPLAIHVLNGFNKIDLVDNNQSSTNLPARFHELLNMFPDNKGVELVIVIGDDDQDDTDYSSLPNAKLKPDRLIITTTGKGRLLDTFEEKRLQRPVADLLVYFNAAYLFSSSNREELKSMLTKQRPILLTFDDQDEFYQAHRFLSAKGVNIHQAGMNQFSSLIIRQRSNKPNSTYSRNSYQILFDTIAINKTAEKNDENASLLSHQRPHQSSIGIQHGHSQQQQQQQLNPGLKQVNGKIHIESLSSPLSHNTHANNNGTLLDTTVHIGSVANTTTTAVQPLVRSNNDIRQPTVKQRRHLSPPSSTSSISNSTMPYRATNTTTAEMMTTAEIIRNELRPQPKPRLSLVKPSDQNFDTKKTEINVNHVQRIKPFFEQPSKDATVLKQHRQSVSIPYMYKKGSNTRATCLDDIVPSTNAYHTPTPPPVEIPTNGRAVTNNAMTASLSPPIEITHEEHIPTKSTTNTLSMSKPTIEPRIDERIINNTTNSASSSSTMPIETNRDQRPVMNGSISTSSSSSSENRSDERIAKPININITSSVTKPPETQKSELIIKPAITKSNSPPVPPRPPLPPPETLSSTDNNNNNNNNNEVIYTEVIKRHQRSLSSHQNERVKSPVSPSRSFVIPATKSPSVSVKASSFNMQRPSRSQTATNLVLTTNRPKPIQSMIPPDRVSLYSQRSIKPSDNGITIKNLSECIDRVGVVFDETIRRNDASQSGLTAVDLIREQLTNSSAPKPAESLLDKLYKSNSSTRLSTSSSRTSTSTASPRSKSQQANKTPDEQPLKTKTSAPPPPPPPSSSSLSSNRKPNGVFLPLTGKSTQEPQTVVSPKIQQSTSQFYQNLEPLNTEIQNYTLKQPFNQVCNGIPKPFRKPTAIIEPSPVVPAPVAINSEPNYINLTHQDEHIYTNENSTGLPAGSNSNSYTSKTSSIYSTSDKQNSLTIPENHYITSQVPSYQQDQSVEYDSFDDEFVVDDMAKIEKSPNINDNTDDDSFDDDDNNVPNQSIPSKNSSKNFFRTTLNRLTRSNKSLERLNNESATNDTVQESNPSNVVDTKAKKTLRSIKARHEAKKTGNLLTTYIPGDDDTTSIDSNCSTQTATSLNKSSTKISHHRFRLFRRKVEKEFASDTEAEKHQTEQRRKKWNKKAVNNNADELKAKRLLMISDDDDDDDNDDQNNNLKLHQQTNKNLIHDEPHIYDHIIHDDNSNNYNNPSATSISRMGKLSHETHFKSPTVTLDEIRSEIQAEIAARQDTQTNNNQLIMSSNLNLQKKRSKSVTFLDELVGDDSKQQQVKMVAKNDLQIKTSTAAKRIEKGDARSICGALTGTGPIRGIIKAANNDITGTTAPVSPSAAATIYLSGTSIDTRCTSPKVNERVHRPLSTYTVGSARFYDGTPASPTTPTSPQSSISSYSTNQNNTVSNQRPILNNSSQHSTSNNTHYKRPTAKVSPFQAKSPNDTSSSSSPISTNKQAVLSSTSKKPIRPITNRNVSGPNDIPNVAISSISDGVGGVSRRLQSNF